MTTKKFWGTAGTGKTTQLLREIDHFVNDGHALETMAFCTYSRPMANDFNTKLYKKFNLGFYNPLKPDKQVYYFSTIHGVCNRVLNLIYGRDITAKPEAKRKFCEKMHVDFTGDRTAGTVGDTFFETKTWLINTFRRDDECVLFGNDFQEPLSRSAYLWLKGEWDVFKDKHTLRDFDDMLLEVYEKQLKPPTNILLVDEFQDLSPLQYGIFKIWKKNADHCIIVGDSNQTIFSHHGADPTFFSNEQADVISTLPLTYRLGKYGWEFARELLKIHGLPVPKVESAGENIDKPVRFITHSTFPSFIQTNRKTFIIANTNKMAYSLAKILEETGIPHLGVGGWRENMIALYNTQLMFMRRHGSVTAEEFIRYANSLRKEHLRIKRKDFTRFDLPPEITFSSLNNYLSPMSIATIANAPFDFSIFKKGVLGEEKVKGTQEIASRGFKLKQALTRPNAHPLNPYIGVYIGTIHSVKGRESDDVFLYDGISKLAERSTNTRKGMDAVSRMFFVGATRHKQRLFILDSYEPFKFTFPRVGVRHV
jgi:DNA helicase-2/ATP-dependent DNA helicase PcrA